MSAGVGLVIPLSPLAARLLSELCEEAGRRTRIFPKVGEQFVATGVRRLGGLPHVPGPPGLGHTLCDVLDPLPADMEVAESRKPEAAERRVDAHGRSQFSTLRPGTRRK